MDKDLIQIMNRKKLIFMRDFLLAFINWEHNQEKSFAILFREELKKSGVYESTFKMRELIGEIEWYFKTSLTMQAFVYFNESLKNGKFDLSLKNGKYDFKTIKAKVDVDGKEKTTNSEQFIKIIREAFAHNNDNDEIANWYSEEDYLIIQSKKDKKGARHNIKIDAKILLQTLMMYLENAKVEELDFLTVNVRKDKLKSALAKNTLTPAQVGNIFKQMFALSKEKEMDKYQKQALFNCLTKVELFKDDNFENLNEDLLKMVFPLKENDYLNGCEILDVTSYLNLIHDNYTSFYKYLQANADIFKDNRDKFNLPNHSESILYFMFGESNKIVSVMINNLLFNMFSFESVENLEKCFRTDLNIKRIRNSIMHGRYFYNYDGAFECYDGIKEMEYIGKISCNEILQATNTLIHVYKEERDNNLNSDV